ncbi:hypothetical protein B932_3520 [Gluconobacter oxydans H24]|nr:hypothetical protein B932_3520 [Gluconobacter oxydans H24]
MPESVQITMHVSHHTNTVFTDSRHDRGGERWFDENGFDLSRRFVYQKASTP